MGLRVAGAEGQAAGMERCPVTLLPPGPHFLPCSFLSWSWLLPREASVAVCLWETEGLSSPQLCPSRACRSSWSLPCPPPHSVSVLGETLRVFYGSGENAGPAERFPRAILRVSALASFILLSGFLLTWLRTGVCPGQRLPGQSSQGGLR